MVHISVESITALIVLAGVTGVIYTLLSEGFTLIYGVAGILNGAYGAICMIADYLVFAFLLSLGLNLFVSIIASMILVFFVGLGIQSLVMRRAKTQLEALFITLAIAFLAQYLISFIQCSSAFSSNCQHPAYVPILITGSTPIFGVSVQNQYIYADILSISILVLMWIFIAKSKLGLAIRAVSEDRSASELVGISSRKIMILVSGIASLMAGISAIFLASYQTVDSTLGWNIITLAFSIVIIGGLGSLKGTILGAFILSFAQTGVSLFVSPLLSDFISLTVLILVILVKPEGVFGKEQKFSERLEEF